MLLWLCHCREVKNNNSIELLFVNFFNKIWRKSQFLKNVHTWWHRREQNRFKFNTFCASETIASVYQFLLIAFFCSANFTRSLTHSTVISMTSLWVFCDEKFSLSNPKTIFIHIWSRSAFILLKSNGNWCENFKKWLWKCRERKIIAN